MACPLRWSIVTTSCSFLAEDLPQKTLASVTLTGQTAPPNGRRLMLLHERVGDDIGRCAGKGGGRLPWSFARGCECNERAIGLR